MPSSAVTIMRKAFIQLHIAIFLAGFTGILGRLITLSEGLLVWYRMLFAAAALLILSLAGHKPLKLSRTEWLPLFGVGTVIALHWVFFYGSIKYANVSIGLICFSAVGFFTALIDPFLSERRIDPMEIALGLLVMLGIYFIFHFEGQYQTGILLGIVSSLLASLFPILNKSLLNRHEPATVTFYELAGGWIALTALMPAYLYLVPDAGHLIPTRNDFLWMLFLSLACTVLAFNLSLQALKKISPFTVNLSYNLEPIYGILLAFLVYQENRYLGRGFYVGFGIIFLTVILQSWRVWRKRAVKSI
jgi:drug/metabolite transporter (DMT)-like permease